MTEIPTQTPRPWLTPLIKKIVQEHLKFYYSPILHCYISSGFYSGETELYESTPNDDENIADNPVKSNISYNEVKEILRSSENTSFMTLQEFWTVYHELINAKGSYFLKKLRDKNYVEILDTMIVDKKITLISQENVPETFHVPIATPGLLDPLQINLKTGLPAKVLHPNQYDDPTLWRYWSPDSSVNVATRGHIFVLDRSAIDLKVRPDDKTARLTFRPMYKCIPNLKYEVTKVRAEGEITSREARLRDFKVVVRGRVFSVY